MTLTAGRQLIDAVNEALDSKDASRIVCSSTILGNKEECAMSTHFIPEGYHTITPYLVVEDADTFLDFLTEAFGAITVYRMVTDHGIVTHATVKIGDSMMMVGAKQGGIAGQSMLYLYVPDVDAMYHQAIAAGATSIKEPDNQFYGDRNAAVQDNAGNQWWLATHIEDLDPVELADRAKAFYEKHDS